MNPDKLRPEERCAPTRTELRGPPGPGGRTHLMSPAMAAAAAVTGRPRTCARSSPTRARSRGHRRPAATPTLDAFREQAVPSAGAVVNAGGGGGGAAG